MGPTTWRLGGGWQRPHPVKVQEEKVSSDLIAKRVYCISGGPEINFFEMMEHVDTCGQDWYRQSGSVDEEIRFLGISPAIDDTGTRC